MESTNLKRDLGNTEDSLCNGVQLSGVNFMLVPCGTRQPTSAKAAPNLIALSTHFSFNPLIIGVYSFSNPSSSWSDERRASPYAEIIRCRDGRLGEKVRTELFAENRTSREPLYFPMTTASVLLNQLCADWW